MDREGLEASHEPAQPAPVPAIGPALAPGPFTIAGGAGPDLGSLAALPPPSRAAAFARLQAGAGNYAVSRVVLARVEDSDLAARHEEGERNRLRDLGIDFDLERADDATKLDAIRRLMPSQATRSRTSPWNPSRCLASPPARTSRPDTALRAHPQS